MKIVRMVTLVAATTALGTASAAIDWHDAESIAQAAIAASPSRIRIESELEAARQRARAAGSLPNPMLMAGVENLPLDLGRDEMTMYTVGASQTFTRGSVRSARTSAASLAVRRLELEAQSIEAEVRREALFAYYELARADSQIGAIEQVGSLLELIAQAARIRYETGSASQAELIRAQLRATELEHDRLTFDRDRRVALARLLPLLDLPGDADPPRLVLAHSTFRRGIPGSTAVSASHPAIAALQTEVELAELDVALAKLAYKPEINIEALYGARPQLTDMVTVMARVEIPYRKSTLLEPRVREAIARRNAARGRLEATRRSLAQALGIASAIHDEASKQVSLHEQRLLPQTRLALQSAIAAYQTGQSTLEPVLAIEEELFRRNIELYTFLAKHIESIVDYEALQKGARSGAIGSGGSSMESSGSSKPASDTSMSSMGGSQ